MTSLTINHTTRQIPTTWNELTTHQLERLMQIISIGGNTPAMQVKALCILWPNGRWDLRAQWVLFHALNILTDKEQDIRITHLLNEATGWIFETNTLTAQPYKKIKITGLHSHLYGPGDGWPNITGLEFAFAERFFWQWHQQQDKKDLTPLHLLAAIIYRRKARNKDTRHQADVRVPFNPDEIESTAFFTARQPHAQLLAIYTFYSAIREQIIQAPSNKRIFTKSNKKKGKGYGWLGIFLDLGGSTHHQQVANQPLAITLIDINQKLDKVEELERKKRKK